MKISISKIVKMGFLGLLFCSLQMANAQSPQKMSYQAVIRNAANVLVSNSTVGVKISILQGSASGTVVYAETHSVGTNANGLATLEIGNGAVVAGNFTTINWANGPYFIKTETDPLGGTNYTISGTNQMLSVPYAFLSDKTVNPTYSVSASDDSALYTNTTSRILWVDDPNILVTAPETGKYLLIFYGTAISNISYFETEADYDAQADVRIYNTTNASELISAMCLRLYLDSRGTGDFNFLKMAPLPISRSIIVNLTAGDQLKLQYRMLSVGSTLPTGTWIIGPGGISILKIGN